MPSEPASKRAKHTVDSVPVTTEEVNTPASIKAAESAAFVKVYEELRDELVGELRPNFEMTTEAVQWIEQMIDYTVPGGKMNRGMSVKHTCEIIAEATGVTLSPEDAKRASVLGWCVEWLQAFFLVADDVMDDSVTRRGQPCWYRRPDVKLIAVNDSFLLQSHVFRMLKRHCSSLPSYAALLELFLEVTYQTELGQLLDLTSQPMDGPKDLDRFTMERYNLIVRYKTAFYTFHLPVSCALHVCGIASSETLKLTRDICVRIGEFFQIQDDYLDCYGDPEVIGKVGTDIQDNKCSWLVVQALARVTPEQRELLNEHYGTWNEDSVAKVKALYQELDLSKLYQEYEEESYNTITGLIGDLGEDVPKEVFHRMLAKIYKRAK